MAIATGFLFEDINQYLGPLKWNTFNSLYVLQKGNYDLLSVSKSIIGKNTDRIVWGPTCKYNSLDDHAAYRMAVYL
jgi:hypothetical protein